MKTWKGGFVFVVLAGLLAITGLTGCGSQAGWRFSIGVSPVTAINDQQSLTPVEEVQKR